MLECICAVCVCVRFPFSESSRDALRYANCITLNAASVVVHNTEAESFFPIVTTTPSLSYAHHQAKHQVKVHDALLG